MGPSRYEERSTTGRSRALIGALLILTCAVRSEAQVTEAMARYRLQGAAYAVVLEAALGRPVTRCVFVFAEPHMERDVDNLQTAMVAVRAEIQRRLTPAGR